jgi:hypothetical protein
MFTDRDARAELPVHWLAALDAVAGRRPSRLACAPIRAVQGKSGVTSEMLAAPTRQVSRDRALWLSRSA